MGFLSKWYVTAAGYALAALFLWLYIDAQSEIKAEIERCNTEKLASVAEAERVARQATQADLQAQIDALVRQSAQADRAREIAEEAARLAESRVPEVREIIREVASDDACIDTAVPDAVLNSMRD